MAVARKRTVIYIVLIVYVINGKVQVESDTMRRDDEQLKKCNNENEKECSEERTVGESTDDKQTRRYDIDCSTFGLNDKGCTTSCSKTCDHGNGKNTNSASDSNDKDKETFEFEKQSSKTDFVLIVEDRKLYVSKNILSLASPVFEKRFESELDKTDKSQTQQEMELPNKRVHDVVEFLKCIYPNILAPVTVDNALGILPLIHEFKVDHLLKRCENILVESVDNDTSADRLLQLLVSAHAHGLNTLREKCTDMASRKTQSELTEAEKNHKVPDDAMNEVLKKVNLRLTADISSLNGWLKIADVFLAKSESIIEYLETFAPANTRNTFPFDKIKDAKSVKLLLPTEENSRTSENIKSLIMNISVSVTAYHNDYHGPYSGWKLFMRIDTKENDTNIAVKARVVLVNKKRRSDDLIRDINEVDIPVELANLGNVRNYGSDYQENNMFEIWVHILLM